MNDEVTRRQQRLMTHVSGLLAGAFALAYFCQPLMKFAHPGGLSLGGVLIGLGILAFYLSYVVFRWENLGVALMALGLLVGGLFVVGICWVQAYQVSRENDKHCAIIERDMLSQHPGMNDDGARFQALMCRPTGSGIVIE